MKIAKCMWKQKCIMKCGKPKNRYTNKNVHVL